MTVGEVVVDESAAGIEWARDCRLVRSAVGPGFGAVRYWRMSEIRDGAGFEALLTVRGIGGAGVQVLGVGSGEGVGALRGGTAGEQSCQKGGKSKGGDLQEAAGSPSGFAGGHGGTPEGRSVPNCRNSEITDA